MRLFIAINLNDSSEYFKELQKQIDKSLGEFSFTSSYHITLKFLPNIKKEELIFLLQELSTVKFEKFDLTLCEVKYFRNKLGPSVIWQGVESEGLAELQKQFDEICKTKTLVEFCPHVTLARVKHNNHPVQLIQNIKHIETTKKIIEIDKFVLYQSKLTKEGATHQVIEEFKAL